MNPIPTIIFSIIGYKKPPVWHQPESYRYVDIRHALIRFVTSTGRIAAVEANRHLGLINIIFSIGVDIPHIAGSM
jgi:hypothetical protein